MPPIVLRPAAVTAVGSFPGEDVWETAAVVRGELPDLPVLPELPARGPGADMIGRTLALLSGTVSAEFAATTTTTGWRMTGQSSADLPRLMRRGLAWLGEDLDAAQSQWSAYGGPFKLQLVGPWTLAATVEAMNGERLISDAGAVRDIAAGLAEAAVRHLADIRRRLPEAQLIVQLDEPSLPSVLAGRLRTQSGWGAHRPIPEPELKDVLAQVLAAVHGATAGSAVHCCGRDVPIDLLRECGAAIISLDLTFDRSPSHDEAFGQLLDAGTLLMAGIVDPVALQRSSSLAPAALLKPLLTLLNRLAVPYGDASASLLLSPSCGLAGAGSMAATRPLLAALGAAGRVLRDEQVTPGREEER